METYLHAIEQDLAARLSGDDPVFAGMLGMLRYHLGWVDAEFRATRADSGKRVRALLCLFASTAVGADWHAALPAAAALELVHNFSLIHDDIEDASDERRGRTALWKVWGIAQGINAGDAMFVMARLALDDLATHPYSAEIHRVFDRATFALTQGQFLDLSFESRSQISEDEYFKMIGGKTAALIAAAARLGALVGSADQAEAAALEQFGRNVGLAFQITDDILGLWGDPKVTGKSAETDILSRKKSLPVVYALGKPEMEPLRVLYARGEIRLSDAPIVRELLEQARAKEYAQSRAAEYYRAGERALSQFPPEATRDLRQLASLVIDRVK